MSDSSVDVKPPILPQAEAHAATQQNWGYTDFEQRREAAASIVSSTFPLVDSAPEPSGTGAFFLRFLPPLIIFPT
ncbi:MAG: hypothetical protein H7322_08595 [Ramlibacter sp.]|nr:hypothetical protein [Ramlibacter sp.]